VTGDGFAAAGLSADLAEDLAAAMAEVSASRKYRAVDPGLVEAIVAEQLRGGGSLRDVIKRSKRKLHQVFGAYLGRPMPFAEWLAALRAASDAAARAALCRRFMTFHASTRERVAHLEAVYAAALGDLPMPARVLDLGCGLNPLGRPFMPLAAETALDFCDVHRPFIDFLGDALTILGLPGAGWVCNLLDGAPPRAADVVLLLKVLPCLEQLDQTIAPRLIAGVRADVIVVSFPVASLGGRRKGMAGHYAAHFERAAQALPMRVERRDAPGELVYRLHRRA
jgi:16S rRNA (guanine(1405)-N(7))-methyltransferase